MLASIPLMISPLEQPAQSSDDSVRIDRRSIKVAFSFEMGMSSWEEHDVREWRFVVNALPIDPSQIDPDEDEYLAVGHGVALTVLVGERDPSEALDLHSAAALRIGEILFESGTGQLVEEFCEQIEQIGDRVLILSEIEIDPIYRGQGLGPLAAGLVIEALSGGALAVVCDPAPMYRPLDEHGQPRPFAEGERDAAVAKLTKLWSTLGFREFREGLLFLDPVKLSFLRAFNRITAQLETE